MSKREQFWNDVPRRGDGEIDWPADEVQRMELASDVVGAVFVGALHHVLDDSLATLDGVEPEPSALDFRAKQERARVMAGLTPEQRDALASLLREATLDAAYWTLVKLRHASNDLCVELVARRTDEHGVVRESFVLNEEVELHQLFLDWEERFG